ncbi:MAG: hypothetical protein L0H31_09650 [Nocardioidaceae bacterium]|nr:hypothetical protein [Nocardioidaceae bacterium]
MAKDKRQWDRYRPPAQQRGEGGTSAPAESTKSSKPAATARPSTTAQRTSTKSTNAASSRASQDARDAQRSMAPWLVALVVVIVVVVIAVVVTKVNDAGSNPGDNPELDRKTLDATFLDDAIAVAKDKGGDDPVSMSLSDYQLTVEYFDPNAQQVSRYRFSTSREGYSVDVEENPYPEYRPRRFQINEITAQALIDAVDTALDKASEATYFTLTVEADRETGDVSIVVRASGDGDRVEITTAP